MLEKESLPVQLLPAVLRMLELELENDSEEKDVMDADLMLGGLRLMLGGLRCGCSDGVPSPPLASLVADVALRFLEFAFALDRVVMNGVVSLSLPSLFLAFFFSRREDLLVPTLLLRLVSAAVTSVSLGWTFSSNKDEDSAAVVELERRYIILLRLAPPPLAPTSLSSNREMGLSCDPSTATPEVLLLVLLGLLLLFADVSNSITKDSTLGVANCEVELFLVATAPRAARGGGRGKLGLFFLGLDMCSNSSIKSNFDDRLSSLACAL
mmetsp:Transcript_7236/g.12978  ORF Transcript_7236/g.12978 Transcript_7236/m.12978 type:complete len:267 (-) Transcript_7236:173-973(-)